VKANYTVIIDTLGSNCFVMSLDRSLVPAPSSMMDMIHKIKHGLYDIDFRNIKKVSTVHSSIVRNPFCLLKFAWTMSLCITQRVL
jgi:hypothetical protein